MKLKTLSRGQVRSLLKLQKGRCAISGKKIPLEKLTYWNVELQEAYFSYVEASLKRDKS